MAAMAAAPPLVAAGPPGWVALRILGVAIVGAAAVMKASEQADEDFADEEPNGVERCLEDKANPSGSKGKSEEFPYNPDDLLEDGYEDITHPGTLKHIREFRNPKTGDRIDFNKGKPNAWLGGKRSLAQI